MSDPQLAHDMLTKVPAVTLGFWIIKILATTLGETGGDTVNDVARRGIFILPQRLGHHPGTVEATT
jgi:uncharacterized membrane-anchored protein